MYYFDLKHRAIAYSNLKRASEYMPGVRLSAVTKESFRIFGQNIIDVFLIPLINRQYIDKHISIEGGQYIDEAFRAGKGIIFVSVHAGSWELSNIICANIGLPFRLFIRNQNLPRLNELLNSYRRQKGCRIFEKGNDLRRLIEALKNNNEAIGMTVDQGGRPGVPVKFFGKNASFATGALKLALKYNATILPVFYRRVEGLNHKITIEPPFKIKQTGDFQKDIVDNLQELVQIFQRHIQANLSEYLWTYKIWKYSNHRDILVLSDGKAGHLRQTQALVKTLTGYLTARGISTAIRAIQINFKNKFSRHLLTFCGCLAGKYQCQGCLRCLRGFLSTDTHESLISAAADIVISCGSSLAAINYIISKENQAKSIVIMRPSVLSFNRFDLVVMPGHDNPPERKNVVVTEGALNLIDEGYLKEQAKKLAETTNHGPRTANFNVGFLIGGDTRDFRLDKKSLEIIISELKSFAQKENVGLLVSTSRRTSPEIEQLVKDEFKDFLQCKFMVIASENNPAFSVGGILGLSNIVIVSPESISMVSEAASSGRYVIVFKSKLDYRHRNFLARLADKKYIYLVQPEDIGALIDKIISQQPVINVLQDTDTLKQALGRII